VAKGLFANGCFAARMMLEKNSIESRLRLDTGGLRPKIDSAAAAHVRSRLTQRQEALANWQAAEIRKHENGGRTNSEQLRRDLERTLNDSVAQRQGASQTQNPGH